MRIEVKGRHDVVVTDELQEYVRRRFAKVARQVSELATLEVELRKEHNPAIAENQIAEATLSMKGATLRASDRSREMRHAIHLCEQELARQVSRHRDKRRGKVGAETIRIPSPDTLGEDTAIAG